MLDQIAETEPPKHPLRWLVGVAVLIVILTNVMVWGIDFWFAPYLFRHVSHATLAVSIAQTVVTSLGAVGIVVGLFNAGGQIQHASKQLHLAADQQITSRLAVAINQLGAIYDRIGEETDERTEAADRPRSENQFAVHTQPETDGQTRVRGGAPRDNRNYIVRTGAIYSLERIFRQVAGDDQPLICRLLCAYLQEDVATNLCIDMSDEELLELWKQEPQKVRSDVAAVLAVLRRRGSCFMGSDKGQEHGGRPRENFRLNLGGIHFDWHILDQLHLEGAELRGSSLNHAHCTVTRFDYARAEATLWVRARLQGATFRGANLDQVKLCGARIGGADFTGADLREADLRGVDLEDFASLPWEDWEGIKDQPANFAGADLSGADLREVDFTRVVFGEGLALVGRPRGVGKHRPRKTCLWKALYDPDELAKGIAAGRFTEDHYTTDPLPDFPLSEDQEERILEQHARWEKEPGPSKIPPPRPAPSSRLLKQARGTD